MSFFSELTKSISLAILASVLDAAKNVFRPIHNAKIVLGIEEDVSISDAIDDTKEKIQSIHTDNV